MTSWVVLQFLEWFQIDPEKQRVIVLTPSTSQILGGTSANLLAGDKMSIHELMYGMMLPSGNDAAQTLAIYIGNYLLKAEKAGKVRGAQSIDGNIYEEDYPEDEE